MARHAHGLDPHRVLVAQAVGGEDEVAGAQPEHAGEMARLRRGRRSPAGRRSAPARWRSGALARQGWRTSSRVVQPVARQGGAPRESGPLDDARPCRPPRRRGCRPARGSPPGATRPGTRGRAARGPGQDVGEDERRGLRLQGGRVARRAASTRVLTPLSATLARALATASGSSSTARTLGDAQARGGDGQDARARPQVEGPRPAAGARAMRSSISRHPAVLPCCPVPKARPGSMTMVSRPGALRRVPGRRDQEPLAHGAGSKVLAPRLGPAGVGRRGASARVVAHGEAERRAARPGSRAGGRRAPSALAAAGKNARRRGRARRSPPRGRRGRPAPTRSS